MATKVKKEIGNKTKFIITAVILSAAVAVTAVVGVISNNRETEYYDFQKDVAVGIDVSEHNGKIDWVSVSENADFAFIRVGYRGYGTGKIAEDELAEDNLRDAQKAGIPFGVYFYSQAISEEEAEKEADFVLKTVRHYKPQLPLIIDFEYASDEEGNKTGRLFEAHLSSEENTNIINAFCRKIKDKGYSCGLYASSSVLRFDIDTKNLVKDTAVWVADYSDSVRYDVDYKIWQYSRTGTCEGVSSKNVDLNYYYSKIQKGD